LPESTRPLWIPPAKLADDGGLKGSIAVAGVEGTFTAMKQ